MCVKKLRSTFKRSSKRCTRRQHSQLKGTAMPTRAINFKAVVGKHGITAFVKRVANRTSRVGTFETLTRFGQYNRCFFGNGNCWR